MACGDVFYHDTPHAIGKGPKCIKYHLHIADDDYVDPNLLLFISTDVELSRKGNRTTLTAA